MAPGREQVSATMRGRKERKMCAIAPLLLFILGNFIGNRREDNAGYII